MPRMASRGAEPGWSPEAGSRGAEAKSSSPQESKEPVRQDGLFAYRRRRGLEGQALRSASDHLRTQIGRASKDASESACPGLEPRGRKSRGGSQVLFAALRKAPIDRSGLCILSGEEDLKQSSETSKDDRRPGARDHLSVRRDAMPRMASRGAEPGWSPEAGGRGAEAKSSSARATSCSRTRAATTTGRASSSSPPSAPLLPPPSKPPQFLGVPRVSRARSGAARMRRHTIARAKLGYVMDDAGSGSPRVVLARCAPGYSLRSLTRNAR
jgi:hypothetical protein